MNISPINYNYSNVAFASKKSETEKPPKMSKTEKKEARLYEKVSDPDFKPKRPQKAGIFALLAAISVFLGVKTMPAQQSPFFPAEVSALGSSEFSSLLSGGQAMKEITNRFFDINLSMDKNVKKVGFEAKYYYNNGLSEGNIAGRIVTSEDDPNTVIISYNDSQKQGTQRYSIEILMNDNVERQVVFTNLDNEDEKYTYYEFMGNASVMDKDGKEVSDDKDGALAARSKVTLGAGLAFGLLFALAGSDQIRKGIAEHHARKELAAGGGIIAAESPEDDDEFYDE